MGCPAGAAEPAADAVANDPSLAAKLEFFEQKVRPLLAEKCFSCHGPEAKSIKGGLHMLSHQTLLQGGDSGAAIVPGHPDQSLLMESVKYDGLYQMPPDGPLPQEQVAWLEQWIRDGAVWPDTGASTLAPAKFDLEARKNHWCWQPLAKPRVPEVKRTDWPQNAIDRFILARLEQQGLEPAPPAPPNTLLRRLSFDLVGLPPRPEVVASLGQSNPSEPSKPGHAPDAWNHYIDALLHSPQLGERWARHWMDLVRYAETYGHEFDYALPYAFEYRDYLIRAFNADLPYDQFVREQLAGDLLENPRLHPRDQYNESIIGSGFWWLGEAVHAPTDVLTDEADRLDNMVDVMSKTFLGLTVACARCHDHKFDAISTQDYYSLVGYVQSSRRQVALLDPHGQTANRVEQLQKNSQQRGEALRQILTNDPNASAVVLQRSLLALRDLVQQGFISSPADASSDPSATGAIPAWLPADQPYTPEQLSQLEKVAGQYGLSVSHLQRWADRCFRHEFSPAHPLLVWREWLGAQRATDQPAPDWKSFWAQQAQRYEPIQQADRGYLQESLPLLETWKLPLPQQHQSGFAFQGDPARLIWDPTSDKPQWRSFSRVDSGSLSPQLTGAWRTPTFVLKEPRLHYLLAARQALVRVYIDGHFMTEFHQLLFGSTYNSVDTQGKWQWFQQIGDLNKYIGHRVYLEIVDGGGGDVAVRDIRQGHTDPPPPLPLAAQLDAALRERGAIDSGEAWAGTLAGWHAAALEAWHNQAMSELQHEWLCHLQTEQLLPVSADLLAREYAAWRTEKQLCESAVTPQRQVLASADGTGLDRPIYIRGNARSLGPMAPRRLPVAMGGEQQPLAPIDQCGRRELAERMLADGQHFVARVMANRVWHHLLGRGIVPTVDNFGVLGQPPTHPELLDYLASELIESGWSLKHLMRLITQSATYQMSSAPTAADSADPANLVWHRAQVRRLQGEAIRDAMLQVAGDLQPTMYGNSVPIHLTPFMTGRGQPTSGPLDGQGRRSIYVEVRRNFLSPMMLAFDTPIPFNSVGQRSNSNVPAQALMLLNDPFVIHTAERWATDLLRQTPSARLTDVSPRDGLPNAPVPTVATCADNAITCEQRLRTEPAAVATASTPPETTPEIARLRQLYQRAFARDPSPQEESMSANFLAAQRKQYAQQTWSVEQVERQVWIDLCHAMLNLKEFVYLH